MRILLVSTLKRAVAPNITASRSRIIYTLGKGLAQNGHSVSLLGTGDSSIEGVTTIPVIPRAWNDLPVVENAYFQETASLDCDVGDLSTVFTRVVKRFRWSRRQWRFRRGIFEIVEFEHI